MKIEICESLIFSWLRHVQGCIVTQMNWKPSPTWAVARDGELAEAFDDIRNFSGQAIGLPIFKCGFRQLIRQTEIDVLGLRLDGVSGASSAVAVDSAFHEDGLLYVNTGETAGRVLKKLIRAAFALEAYLDVDEVSIVFATAKDGRANTRGRSASLGHPRDASRRAARLSHAPPALPSHR